MRPGAPVTSPRSAVIDLRTGVALLHAGDGRAGERLIRRALADAGEEELARVMFRLDVTALYWTEEYALAATVLDRLIEHGRRTRHRLLAGWIDTRAAIDFRLGRWNAAEARSAEARRLASELGQTMQLASCLTTSARIAAARGDERRAGVGSTRPPRSGAGRGTPVRVGAVSRRPARARSRPRRRRDRRARAARALERRAASRPTSRSPWRRCDLIEALRPARRSAAALRLCDASSRALSAPAARGPPRRCTAAADCSQRRAISTRSSPRRCPTPSADTDAVRARADRAAATASACDARGGGATRARTCAPRSARSSSSGRRPGRSARAGSWPRRGGGRDRKAAARRRS